MEHVLTNLAGSIRRETLNGRQYIVAPVTLLVPGVLNGSNGPLLYELGDIENTADAWNGMPIVAPNHPTENGKSVSARKPKVLEKYGVGTVFNISTNGKLVGEAWFDEEKANRVDSRIIPDILSGRKLEVSTGLLVKQEQTAGTFNNGRSYSAIAREYRPDHLALILDGRGACNVEDGCGVNNEEDEGAAKNVLFSAGPGLTIDNESIQVNASDLAGDGLYVDGQGRLAVSTTNIGSGLYPPRKKKKVKEAVTKETEEELEEEKAKMAKNQLTDNDRKQIVDELITNCSCSGFSEEDRETLNAMDAAMLAKCKKMMEGMKSTENKLKENEAKLKEAEAVSNAAKVGFEGGRITENAAKPEKKAEKKGPQSMDDWLETAPPEVVAAFNQAKQFSESREEELIEQIVNSRYNTFTEEELKTYSLDDATINGRIVPGLQTIANRLAEQEDRQPVRVPNYLGAAIGNQAHIQGKKIGVPEPLGLPEDAWHNVFNEHRKGMKVTA